MRVTYVVDSYNWALYHRAWALKKYLKFDANIVHFKDLKSTDYDCDTLYLLNWPIHGRIDKKLVKSKLVTTVSSFIGRPTGKDFAKVLKKFDEVSVSNALLFKELSPHLNVHLTPFGVDTNVFFCNTLPSENKNVFGFAGNTERDVKRFEKIREAVAASGKLLKVASHKDNLSREAMNDFYNSIGTLICFSESEGTPNPVFEAAATGRNIITTAVGAVPEFIGADTTYVVRDYDQMLELISVAGQDINSKGNKLLNIIKEKWDWKMRAQKFEKFLK